VALTSKLIHDSVTVSASQKCPAFTERARPLSHINNTKRNLYWQGHPKPRRCLSQFLREAQKQPMHAVLNTTEGEDFMQNSAPSLSVCFIQSPSIRSHKPQPGFPPTAFPPASLASDVAFFYLNIRITTPETSLICIKGGSQQNRSVPTLNSPSLHCSNKTLPTKDLHPR